MSDVRSHMLDFIVYRLWSIVHGPQTIVDGEKCNFCYEDDFLMVWDGYRSGLVGKGINWALGSTLVRINFPGIENDYVYYFLSSKYQEINTRGKGSGTPHVDPYLLWNQYA